MTTSSVDAFGLTVLDDEGHERLRLLETARVTSRLDRIIDAVRRRPGTELDGGSGDTGRPI